MKQDTKEVLNAMIDVMALQTQALEKMNEAIKSAERQIAELMEALDENSDEIAKLRGEVAMLPKGDTVIVDSWPYGNPPYVPYYPQPLITWSNAFPQS